MQNQEEKYIFVSSNLKHKLMNKAILQKKQINVSATSSWVENFAGKWKDSRPTSQIINDIHAARTSNSEFSA